MANNTSPSPATRTKISNRSQPARAVIRCVDEFPPLGIPKFIPCQFNPAKVTYSRSASWTAKGDGQTQMDVPLSEFSGGSGATLTMDLFFDTTESDHRDVRDFTDALISLTKINSLLTKFFDFYPKRPPLVMFSWGEFTKNHMSFRAYIKDVNLVFSMFLPDGTPVRAETSVTFTEYDDGSDLPWQNPTSRSEERKLWVVAAGETIEWIASREYGDARHWRHIADTNDLDDPSDLRPGQILRLTPGVVR